MINKNFVIKNGVEVNTNLLVGDSTLNKVGIAPLFRDIPCISV